MNVNYAIIKNSYLKNKYQFLTRPYELNVFGIRGFDGKNWHVNPVGIYNDVLGFCFKDEFENEICLTFKGTTDSGLKYLFDPINPTGTAILKCGQYYPYKLGLHKGKEALVQEDVKVSVYRDNNKDGKLDFDEKTVVSGFFGINIHRGLDEVEEVGGYSAGCQVFYDLEEFDIFLAFCKKHISIYGNKFSYTLFDKLA